MNICAVPTTWILPKSLLDELPVLLGRGMILPTTKPPTLLSRFPFLLHPLLLRRVAVMVFRWAVPLVERFKIVGLVVDKRALSVGWSLPLLLLLPSIVQSVTILPLPLPLLLVLSCPAPWLRLISLWIKWRLSTTTVAVSLLGRSLIPLLLPLLNPSSRVRPLLKRSVRRPTVVGRKMSSSGNWCLMRMRMLCVVVVSR